ncbi:hypothetical protein Slin15195_G033210 [Septoria linicola]|uniref:Uncharacterized protein n=1 Tax=Septoria linicola TaxID=215465 RepID=A0A9Q9AIN6_9PEZI|nr:hypothetical protein Slin14017_G032230 [Septoria linicola]USW50002.1 hypothetical protein Slin15195_G033210 [Septoria linicola]
MSQIEYAAAEVQVVPAQTFSAHAHVNTGNTLLVEPSAAALAWPPILTFRARAGIAIRTKKA